ncbi:hypothetical protein HAX54_040806, partial [Datura stramonium]|nr:hypothetical protein [Datura stramonium]
MYIEVARAISISDIEVMRPYRVLVARRPAKVATEFVYRGREAISKLCYTGGREGHSG